MLTFLSKKTTPVGLITSVLGSAAGSYFSEEISVGKTKLAQELQKFEPRLTEQQALDAVDGLFEIVDITSGIKPKGKNLGGKNPSKKIDSQDTSNQHQSGGAGSHASADGQKATKPLADSQSHVDIPKTKTDTGGHKTGHGDVPENIIVHEQYKTELRSLMEKPHVKDQKLFEIVDDIYRPNAKVGSGSTAAAARHEILTGESVGGKQHIQKVADQTNRLEKWIISNPTAAAGDRAAAQNILLDLKDALK
jgi:hypothetical protein